VAFPWASNAVGTLVDIARVAEMAHAVNALAWVDAVHYAPHGPIDIGAADVDVLICSPYKFYGPHLGLAFARAELLERWRPYKVRPAADRPLGHRFETGTLPHELLAGFVAAVDYVTSLGWDALVAHETELGERFLRGLSDRCRLYGLPTMDGRVPTFAFTVEGVAPADAAARLGDRGFAVWHGNYYAVEVMKRLGIEDSGGAVRVGIVHYNTPDEVDRLLAAFTEV
jgi:selenocysteine lyase/cysteine desulfurase